MKAKNERKIKDELKELSIAISGLSEYVDKADLNLMEKMGIGSCLASIYGGYERIFEICFEDIGLKIPKGDRWHSELLTRFRGEKAH